MQSRLSSVSCQSKLTKSVLILKLNGGQYAKKTKSMPQILHERFPLQQNTMCVPFKPNVAF